MHGAEANSPYRYNIKYSRHGSTLLYWFKNKIIILQSMEECNYYHTCDNPQDNADQQRFVLEKSKFGAASRIL